MPINERKMNNKIILFSVIIGCAILTGCQTRITAEKMPEQVHPIQQLVNVNGTNAVITTGYVVTSGGWFATARSPLYAKEELRGLEIGVSTNGYVHLSLGDYSRDLSTNSVMIVKEMFSGGAQLAISIGDAYTKIAGGGAQASTVLDIAKKVYSAFTTAGGDVQNATVSTSGYNLTVSDGSVCTTCTTEGSCTTCSCSE